MAACQPDPRPSGRTSTPSAREAPSTGWATSWRTCGDGVVWFTVGVQNSGTAASGDFTVSVVNSAGETVQSETLALASGAATELGPYAMFPTTWLDGLTVTVDGPGAVEECDEADNSLDLGPWPCGS